MARERARGEVVLVKIYERGSAADAEAEARIGALAAGPGVVRYRGAARDAATGRPCVLLDHRPGPTLGQTIARHGPPGPETAPPLLAALASAVARLHELREPEAPQGLVHRDLKPGNVLLSGGDDLRTADVLLLDFEHAVPAGSQRWTEGDGFTGGTHGFAPPEAYAGAPPEPAFDVFALGAILHLALVGRPAFRGRDAATVAEAVARGRRPRQWLDGVAEPLRELIDVCLATDPEHRPAAREVADALAARSRDVDAADLELDGALHALFRGDLAAAAARTATAQDGTAERRRQQLRRQLKRRGRLLARTSHAPRLDLPEEPLAAALALAAAAPRLGAWLDRFPADPDALLERRRFARELRHLLVVAPQRVRELQRGAHFGEAEALLQAARDAARVGERVVADTPPTEPGNPRVAPMERDPQRYLELALRDVAEAAQAYEALVEELRGAEAGLDLQAAQRVLDSASSLYSGATTAVAALKDRVHRFRFYLERIAQPVPELELVQDHLRAGSPELDIAPLRRFQEECATRVGDGATETPQSLRGLRRALDDLLAEFPHTAAAAEGASRVLARSSEALSDRCWALLEEGRRKLGAVPIPIRPLQAIVQQIDALRRLEVLVDRPGRARSALLDELERLRLKADQARITRDRIARGAEEAMERGHLTTALFDMERAVGQLSDETGELEPEGQALVARLEEAKRRKLAVDQAAARSVELGARYAALQDDPHSDPETRIAALEERRQVLLFLVHNLQGERVEHYEADLRDVETALVLERTERGELRLDAAKTAAERERIAEATLAEIGAVLRAGRGPTPGRIRRVLERWEELRERARVNAERDERARRRASRERRTRRALAMSLGVVIVAVVIAFVLSPRGPGSDGAKSLADDLARTVPPPVTAHVQESRRHVDVVSACIALEEFVRVLEQPSDAGADRGISELAAGARKLVDTIRAAADAGPEFELATWATDFEHALQGYAARVAEIEAALAEAGTRPERALVSALRTFGARARATAIAVAAADAGPDGRERLQGLLAGAEPPIAPDERAALERLLRLGPARGQR